MKERLLGLRAARSYAHNHELKPKVEERLDKAESQLRSYLLREGVDSLRLGAFQVEMQGDQLVVTRVEAEGWEQLKLRSREESESLECSIDQEIYSGDQEG